MEFVFIGTVLLGFYMAWNIGANDVANSMADAVGSHSISIKHAVWLAGIFEFGGAVIAGGDVTDTIRKGIISPAAFVDEPMMLAVGMACALLAASLWLHFASWFGMPVSTTHSIVGAVTGIGIVAVGWGGVNWGMMGKIVASWFISPIVGGVLAFILFKLTVRLILGQRSPAKAAIRFAPVVVFLVAFVMSLATFYKGLKHVIKDADWLTPGVALSISAGIAIVSAVVSRKLFEKYLKGLRSATIGDQLEKVERSLAPLVVFTSCCVAFAHGSNDVANAIGPLAAVVEIIETHKVPTKVSTPFWILALGGVGIVVGLSTYGYRVMKTVGSKITQLTPSRGIAADVAAMVTVLACSKLKLPVSTTHTLVGAILGVGLARGLGSVDRTVTRNIFLSWGITVPAAAGLAVILFLVGRLFL